MTAQAGVGRRALAAPGTLWMPGWERAYAATVRLVDVLVVVVAVTVGSVGGGAPVWSRPGAVAVLVAGVLLAALVVRRAWEPRVLGQGAEEFRRLGSAVLAAVVALGLAGLALDVGALRPWVFAVLPATGAALAVSRYVLRRMLHARRRRGLCMVPVLAAGSLEEVADLVVRTRRETHYGWAVGAVCVPGGGGGGAPDSVSGVPVVGDLDDVDDVARSGSYRVLAVAPDAHWTRRRLRDLAWRLEGAPVDLVVAPALMEVTGPRLHVSPVYGLTLLRVSQPTFSGGRWVLKAVLDRVGALLALVLLLPTLALVALAVKLEDGGPVLFRQVRVGKGGELFEMLKFRSMVVDAEERLATVRDANDGAGPLFKLRRDPRVTRVGAVLRRYSLDELPQLVNVVLGDMSMVGPRPPLPSEVDHYGTDARRRLLVKPGLTGLWQVSGRSDLSWEETVRLDLRYVENWSLALDGVILWKTVSAVVHGGGAY